MEVFLYKIVMLYMFFGFFLILLGMYIIIMMVMVIENFVGEIFVFNFLGLCMCVCVYWLLFLDWMDFGFVSKMEFFGINYG